MYLTLGMRMSKTKTAKLFRDGRSQAVRLPREFRFEGNEGFVCRSTLVRAACAETDSQPRRPETFGGSVERTSTGPRRHQRRFSTISKGDQDCTWDRIPRPAKSFTKQQLLPRMKFFADDNGRHYTS